MQQASTWWLKLVETKLVETCRNKTTCRNQQHLWYKCLGGGTVALNKYAQYALAATCKIALLTYTSKYKQSEQQQ